MLLTKQAIAEAVDVQIEQVDVPEWGGHVFVRGMSARARDAWEMDVYKNPTDDLRARLLLYSLCDDNGSLLFNKEDLELLTSKSGTALDRLFDVACRLSKVGNYHVEALKKT